MSTDKPCVLYPNDAVTQRFDALNHEISYRQRVVVDVAQPLIDALEVARRARQSAARELGVDVEKIEKLFFVKGKGMFWEDENWVFDMEKQDLVPRQKAAPAEPAKKSSAKKTTARKRR